VEEQKDANILVVIVEVERVKCADMGENVVAVVPVDANAQRALVALANDSVALKNVMDVDASAK
jgi:hypothetical protein